MPAPVTAPDLFACIEKSRLLTPAVLDRYRGLVGVDTETPAQAADRMVKDGLLTPFQTDLLLKGKTRPFFVGPYKVLSRIG
ncbi:MAG: hypothetical protein K2V38_05150, partial [Gemmataceae bacterium]|nr:hypothetical protein [Gemmataceae bacterium]